MDGLAPTLTAPKRMDIIGFKVSALSLDQNLAFIMRSALSGQGLWILTLNLEMAARSATDPAYRALIQPVDFIVADGMPIVMLSRLGLTESRIPDQSAGVDMTERLLKEFTGRIGILGGKHPQSALSALGVDPARIVYMNNGMIDPDRLDEIISGIKAAQVQLLFVALGVPKQDKVCRVLRQACPALVCMGVGGSFEMLGGLTTRAPVFIRKIGMEWLYRLLQEPKRLAYRYLVLYPQAIPGVVSWIRSRRAAGL